MSEIAKLIIAEGGWVALAFMLLILILGIMSYTLYKLVSRKDSDSIVVATQAEVIAELVAPIKEISTELKTVTTANQSVSLNLLRVAELLALHDQRVTEFRTALDQALTSINNSGEDIDRRLDQLPGKVREEMTPELEKIPKVIEDALTPRIEKLQKEIAELIQNLDDKLTQRLDVATDMIPDKTTQLVRGELIGLQTRINESLRDMIETTLKETQKSIQEADNTASEEKKEG